MQTLSNPGNFFYTQKSSQGGLWARWLPIGAYLSFSLLSPLHSLSLDDPDSLLIGKKIWRNECQETLEGLLTWNAGEEFASLGIGHFIWYPSGKLLPFTETFPDLLRFFQEQQITLPTWLTPETKCPWRSKAEFDKSKRSPKMRDLYELLSRTISLQAQFMAHRFNCVEKALTQSLTQCEKAHVERQIARLDQTQQGRYVLLDYLNFKGDGVNIQERYQGHGWGLLQVLMLMPGNTEDPINEFVLSGERILKDRVELAPPERKEDRWLTGWLRRLAGYQQNNSSIGSH